MAANKPEPPRSLLAKSGSDPTFDSWLFRFWSWITNRVDSYTNADYLVGSSQPGMDSELVVTDTTSITWDLATAGQAKANVVAEFVQDTVGAFAIDSDTVDFVYNDGSNTLAASVITQMSLTSDASGIKLSGDTSTPGSTYYYGTDDSGTKGFFQLFLGMVSASWKFSTTTTAADPGSKNFRFDNATLASVTNIYVNDTTVVGFDSSTLMGFLAIGMRIYIQQKDDPTKAALFQLTGSPTDNTGWWTIPVIVVSSATLPGNGKECAFFFRF